MVAGRDIIYLLSHLSEFYYPEDFCIVRLNFFNIGNVIYDIEIIL